MQRQRSFLRAEYYSHEIFVQGLGLPLLSSLALGILAHLRDAGLEGRGKQCGETGLGHVSAQDLYGSGSRLWNILSRNYALCNAFLFQ